MNVERIKLYFEPIEEKYPKWFYRNYKQPIIKRTDGTSTFSIGFGVFVFIISLFEKSFLIGFLAILLIGAGILWKRKIVLDNKKSIKETEEYNKQEDLRVKELEAKYIQEVTYFNNTIERVKGSEVDFEVMQNLGDNMSNIALEMLGLSKDHVKEYPPIVFQGYYFSEITKITPRILGYTYKEDQIKRIYKMKRKCDFDDKMRSSLYCYTIFFFSSAMLHCYQYIFCLLDNFRLENTFEVSYQDIISISSKTEGQNFEDQMEPTDDFHEFIITYHGGNSLIISMFDDNLHMDNFISLRSIIKEKKENTKIS